VNNLSKEGMSARSWPLSCRYSLMLIDRLAVRMTDDGGTPSDRMLHWALGVLPSGECEITGAWPELPHHGRPWDEMFAELKARGVERIGLIVANALSVPESAARQTYPTTNVLSSITVRAEDEETGPARSSVQPGVISARKARLARRAEATARDLKRLASPALVRHGGFSDLVHATEFLVATFSRAQQRIDKGAVPVERSISNLAASSRRGRSRSRSNWGLGLS
jgi:hypothetical protein